VKAIGKPNKIFQYAKIKAEPAIANQNMMHSSGPPHLKANRMEKTGTEKNYSR